MNVRDARIIVSLCRCRLLAAGSVLAQQAPARRDFDAEIQAALQAAKTAAGFEFLGTLVRTCLLPQSGGEDTRDNAPGYVTNPASAPARDTWYADPAKVFDNLYFVGGKVHSSWALTTSEGIILIDTIFPYNSEELIVGGLKKLGLDPGNIKYLLISHAHGDHIGGAEMLQTRYKPRVVMGEPDWVTVAKIPESVQDHGAQARHRGDRRHEDHARRHDGDDLASRRDTRRARSRTRSRCWTAANRSTWRIREAPPSTSSTTRRTRASGTSRPTSTRRSAWPRRLARAARRSCSRTIRSSTTRSTRTGCSPAGGTVRIRTEVGAEGIQRYFEVMQGCARAAQLRLEQRLEPAQPSIGIRMRRGPSAFAKATADRKGPPRIGNRTCGEEHDSSARICVAPRLSAGGRCSRCWRTLPGRR